MLVSVMTQHLQLVMGQRQQQHGPHPIQLAKAQRPPRPQLQVSLYIMYGSFSVFSNVGFSC